MTTALLIIGGLIGWLLLSTRKMYLLFNLRRSAGATLPCGFEPKREDFYEWKFNNAWNKWHLNGKALLFFFWPIYLLQWRSEVDGVSKALKLAKDRIEKKKQLLSTLETEVEVDRMLADQSEEWLNAG